MKTLTLRAKATLAVAGLAAAAVALPLASCGQTPVNVPIHSFEGAQKVAIVCLQVSGSLPDGGVVTTPVPVASSFCASAPAGVLGATLQYHLIATVTQTTRGELAVVDLSAGAVVDEDLSTPGINFIPVGTNPTDVVIAPGAAPGFVYVSSASPTKPAIFAIDSTRLLGDSDPQAPGAPLTLTDLPVCSLPQPPVALAVAPTSSGSVDGGAIDAGAMADGGAATSGAYQIVALLGAQGSTPPRVVTIDHTALENSPHGGLAPCTVLGSWTLEGAADLPATVAPGPAWPDGVAYIDGGAGDLSAHEPAIDPYGLCSGAVADAGSVAVTPPVDAGTTPVVTPVDAGEDAGDGGAGGLDAQPDAEADDAGTASSDDAGVATAGDAMSPSPVASGGSFPFVIDPLASPRPVSMVMRDDVPLLYVADTSVPMIHVVDLRDPSHPTELAPLLATSVTQQTRQVRVGSLALSPPTHDYKRYLYAVDTTVGSLMVYDVTSPLDPASPHVPVVRPHAELNPFVPSDRITFAAPVAAVAFVQHDWPLLVPNSTSAADQQLAHSGLICNPNPNAHVALPNSTYSFVDLGAYYRVDQAGTIQASGTAQNFPYRLRGIFAFATLTNGSVVAIDVDDWDAPCRRPDPMAPGDGGPQGGITGSLDVPEPAATSTQDLDPYHAPLAYQGAENPPVTLEPFFPVSAPNRVRSNTLLRDDSTGGRVPQIVQPPQLTDFNGNSVGTSGAAGLAQPLMLPPDLDPGFTDPTLVQNPIEPNPEARLSLPTAPVSGNFPPMSTGTRSPGVRLSFEDPTVELTQDWTVTYEGVLPSSAGIVANIDSTTPGTYDTLTFSTNGADLCGLGVEDWSIGQTRANAALTAMGDIPGAVLSKAQKSLPQWTADYVEITDDILLSNDAYWTVDTKYDDDCWDNPAVTSSDGGVVSGNDRYNLCQSTFGAPGTNPDLNLNRDAPILEAYKDHLTVGRFGHPSSPLERTQDRTIDPGSQNSPPFLKLMACCFHKQAKFKVRAGGEWVAVGQQGIGLLHHVVPATSSSSVPADAGAPASGPRCVLSCDPQAALLNARSFDVPWAAPPCTKPFTPSPNIDRNNLLAMRNPMFSYVTWGGCGTPMAGDHTLTARDLAWKFSVSGGFTPLSVSLAGTNGAQVSPQSMLFVSPFGQLAVVDGADQGLVLIDLNSVAFSVNYF